MTNSLDIGRVLACENRILNAWPCLETLVMERWVIRLAGGYSARANAASPLAAGAGLDARLLEAIEAIYQAAGLPPMLRLTPLATAEAARMLGTRGYIERDTSLGMVAPLAAAGSGSGTTNLHISPHATDAWVRGVSALQEGTKRDADAALMAIVSRIRLAAAFAILHQDGRAVGFGMSVIERGMAEIGSVVIDPAVRGKGLGRCLVAGLMGWAARNHAREAYLQVEKSNDRAIRLYAALGFSELYRYRTMTRTG